MRKAARHVQRQAIVGSQFGAVPLQVGGRIRAQIHDRIPQRTADAAHDLDLGSGRQLVMHAAQGAGLCIERVVDLHELIDQAGLLPPISTMGLGRMAVSSEMRVSRPPARMTAFIAIP